MSTTSLPRPPATIAELTVALEQALNALEKHPLANLQLITVTFPTAFVNQRVFHGLGQPIKGFWIVDQAALAIVARSAVVDPDPANFVYLGVNVAGTMTLAVF